MEQQRAQIRARLLDKVAKTNDRLMNAGPDLESVEEDDIDRDGDRIEVSVDVTASAPDPSGHGTIEVTIGDILNEAMGLPED
ncbi:MAG TPA: hypothetical protein VF444_23465 [Pseudonocardiaceae bacterium]